MLSNSAVLSVSLAGPLLLPDCPSNAALHHHAAVCDIVATRMQYRFVTLYQSWIDACTMSSCWSMLYHTTEHIVSCMGQVKIEISTNKRIEVSTSKKIEVSTSRQALERKQPCTPNKARGNTEVSQGWWHLHTCADLLGSRLRESCICSRLFLNAVIKSRLLFFSCSELQNA